MAELDIFASKGFVFHVSSELAGVSGTDKATIYLKNPSTNTLKMTLGYHLVGTDSFTTGLASVLHGNFIHRIYANPTVTANGNALGIISSLITASPPVSVMQAFSLPTVTANGNKIWNSVEQGASQLRNTESIFVINPGNSVLITCTPVNPTTLNVRYFIQWIET